MSSGSLRSSSRFTVSDVTSSRMSPSIEMVRLSRHVPSPRSSNASNAAVRSASSGIVVRIGRFWPYDCLTKRTLPTSSTTAAAMPRVSSSGWSGRSIGRTLMVAPGIEAALVVLLQRVDAHAEELGGLSEGLVRLDEVVAVLAPEVRLGVLHHLLGGLPVVRLQPLGRLTRELVVVQAGADHGERDEADQDRDEQQQSGWSQVGPEVPAPAVFLAYHRSGPSLLEVVKLLADRDRDRDRGCC